jgi:predicted protein tyrosine phosphatase
MASEVKLLFVCSRNRKRSLTAEHAFRGDPHFTVRSAGTEPAARRRVTAGDVGWADAILVMEKRHAAHLHEHYSDELTGKRLIILRIPDDYEFGDPNLMTMLRGRVEEEFGVP